VHCQHHLHRLCASCESSVLCETSSFTLSPSSLLSPRPLAAHRCPRPARTAIASELVCRHRKAVCAPTGGWTKAGGRGSPNSHLDEVTTAPASVDRVRWAELERSVRAAMTQGRGTRAPFVQLASPRFIRCSPSRNKALVAATRLASPCFEQTTTVCTNLLHPLSPRRAGLCFASLSPRSVPAPKASFLAPV
jgi:hypothetical protein